jgi:hypothetical protein
MQLLETVNLKNFDHLSKTHCTVSGIRSCISWHLSGVSLQFAAVVSEINEKLLILITPVRLLVCSE